MNIDINKRGGGGLIQLIAYGAPDVYLHGNTGNPQCYNIRNSMIHYFINRNNGFPLKEDIDSNTNEKKDFTPERRFNIEEIFTIDKGIGFFAHYPDYLKPPIDNLVPFNINKERSSVKIQRAWRKMKKYQSLKSNRLIL